jgi:glycosyltransferase involved in cell wall biosynthesis
MTHLKDLISVIVCTYNQQDTIGRTLDSILSQECHLPFEIIIGEDCSLDDILN